MESLLLMLLALQTPEQLTLSSAVDRALASHPSIVAADAARERAGADIGDARAALRPRLNLDAGLTQFQEPMVVLPLHGFDPRNPPLFDRSLVQSGVAVAWTFYDFGQRVGRVHVQEELGHAAEAAFSSAQRQIVARTATAYVRLATARAILGAHDQRIAALSAARDRVAQRFTEGKAARIDQLRVEAELRRAEADRIASAASLSTAEQELSQLTGIAADVIRRASLGRLRLDAMAYVDTSDAARTDAVARALRSNTEIRELDRRVAAASAARAAAERLRFPELRATGAYTDRGRLKGDFAAEWQIGIGLAYPLYTGGSRSYTIQRASADERAAGAQLRLAQQNIALSIDRALASLREAEARTVALESAVAQSAEVARIEALLLEAGSGTQPDVLDAEANLLRARASLVEAQHAQLTSAIELARLTGDLNRDWLARTLESPQ